MVLPHHLQQKSKQKGSSFLFLYNGKDALFICIVNNNYSSTILKI